MTWPLNDTVRTLRQRIRPATKCTQSVNPVSSLSSHLRYYVCLRCYRSHYASPDFRYVVTFCTITKSSGYPGICTAQQDMVGGEGQCLRPRPQPYMEKSFRYGWLRFAGF